jgi:hypothetical protein
MLPLNGRQVHFTCETGSELFNWCNHAIGDVLTIGRLDCSTLWSGLKSGQLSTGPTPRHRATEPKRKLIHHAHQSNKMTIETVC